MNFRTFSLRLVSFLLSLVACYASALAPNAHIYDVNYYASINSEKQNAQVKIEIPKSHLLKELSFNIEKGIYSNFSANGKFKTQNDRAVWQPPKTGAVIEFDVDLQHKKGKKAYDSFVGKDWALFRGDDLIPSVNVTTVKRDKRPESRATLTLLLPSDWTQAVTGWPKLGKQKVNKNWQVSFSIDSADRFFDRPVGWMMAGGIGVRKELLPIGNDARSTVWFAAPKGQEINRMAYSLVTTLVWPELSKLNSPPKDFAIFLAKGEMWRGGLSGPNALYLHGDRPVISENGTSTLVHELFHSVTRLRGTPSNDWIAEGLAEYYSFQLLVEAGAMSEHRRAAVLSWLDDWSKEVKTLRVRRSAGETTARAALIFADLDAEIRSESKQRNTLATVVKALVELRNAGELQDDRISFEDLKREAAKATGKSSVVLQSALLKNEA